MEPRPSVMYEMIFQMNVVYLYAFIFFEIILGLLKLWTTTCPINIILTELFLFGILSLNDELRINLGRRGNQTNKKIPVLCSILLTIPSIVAVFLLVTHQTYILRMEYFVGAVLLMFQAVELSYGIVFITCFC